MLFANNVATNSLSLLLATIFGLVFYFAVVKAILLMVYMIPQSFPDEVMRIISAGIGDLGQSKGMSTMESSEGTGRIATTSMGGISTGSSDHFEGHMKPKLKEREKAREEEKEKLKRAQDLSNGGGNAPRNSIDTAAPA